jgi:hypothetical protein
VKHGITLGIIAIGSMIHLAAFSSPWAAEANEQQPPNTAHNKGMGNMLRTLPQTLIPAFTDE